MDDGKCHLTALPIEILENIVEYLPLESLILLQCTCKALRKGSVHRSWRHLHLDLMDIGNPPEYLGNESFDVDDVEDSRSFLAQRSRGIRRMKVDYSNLRDFCLAVLNGSVWESLQLVKVFTLESKFYHPRVRKLPMDHDLHQASYFDLANWLFYRALPVLLTGVKTVELFTDMTEGDELPVVHDFMDHFRDIDDLHLRIEGSWLHGVDKLPHHLQNKCRIFKCQYQHAIVPLQLDLSYRLAPGFKSSLKRLDLYLRVPRTVNATEMKQFLTGCDNLETLLMNPIDVRNERGIEWVPSNVQDLALFDRDNVENLQLEFPQVKYFKVDTLSGSIFKRMRFPNLDRLSIESYSGHYEIDMSVMKVRQLRCNFMRPSKIQRLLVDSIESLIIDNPGRELGYPDGTEETPDELQDLIKQLNVRFLLITVPNMSNNHLLTCLYTAALNCKNLELYIQTDYRIDTWPRVRLALHDGVSLIRPTGKNVYRVDISQVLNWGESLWGVE